MSAYVWCVHDGGEHVDDGFVFCADCGATLRVMDEPHPAPDERQAGLRRSDIDLLVNAILGGSTYLPHREAAERIRSALAAQLPAQEERLDELQGALKELYDDYLATYGPDGYPQPMPMAWCTVARWLDAVEGMWEGPRAYRALAEPPQPGEPK